MPLFSVSVINPLTSTKRFASKLPKPFPESAIMQLLPLTLAVVDMVMAVFVISLLRYTLLSGMYGVPYGSGMQTLSSISVSTAGNISFISLVFG